MVINIENNDKMKAIVCSKYGPPQVLKLEEISKPIPKENEILIKIYASTVTVADVTLRGGMNNFSPLTQFFGRIMFGLRKPKRPIQGREIAGEVISVGKKVTQFEEGDQVIGSIDVALGGYAEYVCLPEKLSSSLMLGDDILIKKPENIAYQEAAALPIGGLTALFFLKKGNIKNGQKILVYGASGSVGSFAVQLAKYFGANVTGVCSNTNLDMVKSLGADSVIDYLTEDFTKGGEIYDVIFDAVGKISKSYCRNILNPKGNYVTVNNGIMKRREEDLLFLKKLMEKGELIPFIDKCYPLDQIAKAHNYVEKGHKRGNVVITINDSNSTI